MDPSRRAPGDRGTAPVRATPGTEEASFFAAVGGEPTFRRLVDTFYEGVADDPVLRPLYPEEDLGPAADRFHPVPDAVLGRAEHLLRPAGHPRLRMRHAPFRVGPAERDAWLLHMRPRWTRWTAGAAPLDALGLPGTAAYFMVNTD